MHTDGMGSQEVERNAPGEGMGGRTLTTEKKGMLNRTSAGGCATCGTDI